MPITAKVVSSNPVHGEVYSMRHYVMKFVIDLRQVGGFLRVLRFPPQYSWTIVESGVKHHNPNLCMEWEWYYPHTRHSCIFLLTDKLCISFVRPVQLVDARVGGSVHSTVEKLDCISVLLDILVDRWNQNKINFTFILLFVSILD